MVHKMGAAHSHFRACFYILGKILGSSIQPKRKKSQNKTGRFEFIADPEKIGLSEPLSGWTRIAIGVGREEGTIFNSFLPFFYPFCPFGI